MNQTNINHGPDYDVGILISRRPRDGTDGNARDGTDGNARDGTLRRPRDGTNRKPRDKTILFEGNLGTRDRKRRTEYPSGAQIENTLTTRRRNLWGGYVGLLGPAWERYALT